ncbi:general transcription factor 3C polypeptide 2 [Aplysia californica]|uniref:General transcription factor 3C polypeptide 2 n=1 Tax=Aplysia californica TaxID=6500 RepID=A0ABM1A166_APLCA|nr:general transcription factor 3C polypeptide 2 [Aplysia californica]
MNAPDGTERKSRRKAARSAIKLISQVQVGVAEEKQSSGDEFKDSGDDKSSDGDDLGDGDLEEVESEGDLDEGDEGEKSDDQTMSSRRSSWLRKQRRWRMFQYGEMLWKTKRRLALLRNFYLDMDGRDDVFPELRPDVGHWGRPLSHCESAAYLPSRLTSMGFTQSDEAGEGGSGGDDEQLSPSTLRWGETTQRNGVSYSYSGGPIWAVEWCPLPHDARTNQLAAVAADVSDAEPPCTHTALTAPALVQMWTFGGLRHGGEPSSARPRLQMCVAHDGGFVRSMAWCPYRAYDTQVPDTDSQGHTMPRLGLLAVGGSHGKVEIFSIPHLESLPHSRETESSAEEAGLSGEVSAPDRTTAAATEGSNPLPAIYKPKPVLTLMPNTSAGPCLCVAWQNAGDLRYILSSYGTGGVFLWDLESASPLVRVDRSSLLPVRCFKESSLGVVGCVWSARCPYLFVTASLSMAVSIWDIRKPQVPLSSSTTRNAETTYARAVCSTGPIRAAFLSTADRIIGKENCPLSITGLTPSFMRIPSLRLCLARHFDCIWDVSFCPRYEVALSCDAAGNLMVTVPPLTRFLTRSKLMHMMYLKIVPTALVYKARLKAQQTSEHRREAAASTSATDGESQEAEQDPGGDVAERTLHFRNIPVTNSFKFPTDRRSDLTLNDTEPLGENIQAVHRARLNPNRSSCLWAVSGGQAGLLRLDNLFGLVSPRCRDVRDLLN